MGREAACLGEVSGQEREGPLGGRWEVSVTKRRGASAVESRAQTVQRTDGEADSSRLKHCALGQ